MSISIITSAIRMLIPGGSKVLSTGSRSMMARALVGAEAVSLIDFGVDMWAGEDVGIPSNVAITLGLLPLYVIGGRWTMQAMPKIASKIKVDKSSVKAQMARATAGTTSAMNSSMKSASAMAKSLSGVFRHPKDVMRTVIAASLPWIARSRTLGTNAGKYSGEIYTVVRDRARKAYVVAGKDGSFIMSLSPQGMKVATKYAGAVGLIAIGTALGLDLLESDDEEVISAIAEFLSAQASILAPGEEVLPSPYYSEVLNADVSEMLDNSEYYIGVIQSQYHIGRNAALRFFNDELDVLRTGGASKPHTINIVDGEETTFWDDAMDFIGIGDDDDELDPEAVLLRAVENEAAVSDGTNESSGEPSDAGLFTGRQ